MLLMPQQCVQTSRRVLPLEQLQACLASHVFDGSAEGAAAASSSEAQEVGMSWEDLQSTILVCLLFA